jgi:hypothetical protein
MFEVCTTKVRMMIATVTQERHAVIGRKSGVDSSNQGEDFVKED